MRKPKNSEVVTKTLDKEVTVIDTDTDTDEVGGRMLALCGEVNTKRETLYTSADNDEENRASTQIVCADELDSGLDYDLEYKKYLASCSKNQLYFLEDNERESSPMRLMFSVDNEVSDRRKGRPVKTEKSRAERKANIPTTVSSVSKRLKAENGRADHKPISVKKEKCLAGRKSKSPSVSKRLKIENGRVDPKLVSRTVFRTNENQQMKGDAHQGMKKACKKENKVSSARRKIKSQTISSASKKLKTENESADCKSISRTFPVVNTKNTQQKKGEAMQGRKIPETKNNVESKSTSHVKYNILNSLKAGKKVNEERLSSIDKSYAYYLASLRNSITIFKPDQQVKPVKDLVCLSDPDIIAISDHPFSDGDNIPFETNKDEKVIDLEDDVEPDDIFNSFFSKKLMEILNKPYDEKEFVKLYNEVTLKRPLTRCRQLRDGREIEYNVDNQSARSYLEQYKDFNKKLCRYGKDGGLRALNLLRGFFFYFENIVLEGAFKPWMYEKRLENICCNLMLEDATIMNGSS